MLELENIRELKSTLYYEFQDICKQIINFSEKLLILTFSFVVVSEGVLRRFEKSNTGRGDGCE